MDVATLVLDYVRAILSAPVVIGAIALTFLLLFKTDVKSLMARIARIRLPGGSELLASQQSRAAEDFGDEPAPDVPEDEQIPLLDELKLSKDQMDALRQLYNAERANAYLWEYRYLNLYLAPGTQRVLDWFATLPQATSLSLFDNLWSPPIPSAEERLAIITALQTHHLIMTDGDLVQITPKGREYLQWRGPMSHLAI